VISKISPASSAWFMKLDDARLDVVGVGVGGDDIGSTPRVFSVFSVSATSLREGATYRWLDRNLLSRMNLQAA